MTERRYSEDEVREIFHRASETQETQEVQALTVPSSGSSEGLTLAELQEIGAEVGLPREHVALAARALDAPAISSDRRVLGLPLGVGRTVELARPLTEEEWHRVVVDLRDTFGARGKLHDEGPFRQWTNGNLEALLEPTPTGQRLRLRTLKGNALPLMGAGLGMLGIAAAVFVASRLTGGAVDVSAVTMLGLLGGGMIGAAGLQLPPWARIRRSQMEAVAERAAAIAASTPERLPSGD